ncbi:MAG: P-loop NTPase [Proteobacteria bacterium]|nr:P-loop NTPase [Pseudomonadota bacterium]
MKLIIAGKGGSGKSTLSTLIAKKLSKKGFNILLIDTDESNMGLSRMIGMSPNPVLMDELGGKKGFKQKMSPQPLSLQGPELFSEPVAIDDIRKDWVSKKDGITLLSIGKIHTSGEGCACPMGALSRLVLSKLILNENDIAIIDTTAGIEHFGRGIDEKCDHLLIVVDPTHESFALARKISIISKDAGLDYAIILNKASNEVRDIMLENVDKDRVIGVIPNESQLFLCNLKGEPLTEEINAVEDVCAYIINAGGKG